MLILVSDTVFSARYEMKFYECRGSYIYQSHYTVNYFHPHLIFVCLFPTTASSFLSSILCVRAKEKKIQCNQGGALRLAALFYELILYSVYLLMCLLSEGRVGEAWEPSTKLTLFLPPNWSDSHFHLPYLSLTHTTSWDSLSLVRFQAVEWPRHFDRGGSRSREVRL
jgi:hypothetical protein